MLRYTLLKTAGGPFPIGLLQDGASTDCLCSRLSFRDNCTVNTLGRWRYLPLQQRTGLFIALEVRDVSLRSLGPAYLPLFIEDLDSLHSGFLTCNTTHCMCVCHLALFTSPYGNWRSGKLHMMIFWSSLLMSNKLPSVSDPGSSLVWKSPGPCWIVYKVYSKKFTLMLLMILIVLDKPH